MNRKWDIKNEVIQKKCIDEVITRIQEIDGEPVGMFAAQDIIDIVTANCGPEIYNSGLKDAKKLIQDRFHDLEVDIDLLEQT